MRKGFVLLSLGVCIVWSPVQAQERHSLRSLQQQIGQIAQATRGPVGVALQVVEGGESVTWQGQRRFPMQSVYKLPIAMAVLRAVEKGKLTLEQSVRIETSDLAPAPLGSPIREKYPQGKVALSVRELLWAMMVESDGTASDLFLRLLGGPKRVTAYLRQLGVKGMVVATTEREMAQSEQVQYRNWATPQATIQLLGLLQRGKGLSAPSRALLLRLMTESTTGPDRLKGLLPAGTSVAHKTGTSRTVGGITRATNDVGLITLPNGKHLAIAVFVSNTQTDEATREGVIAQIARAAWDYLTTPPGVPFL